MKSNGVAVTVLDIDLLCSFVGIAEAGSFTEAGDRLGATQSAISVRLKKLEARLGRPLMDRTPRAVALTPFGADFLVDARRLLALHDDMVARATASGRPLRLEIGITEHLGEARLGALLADLKARLPTLKLGLTLSLSEDLLDRFEENRFDAVVLRRLAPDARTRAARRLYGEDLVWCAAPDLAWTPGEPVPLVSVGRPCGVCAAAVAALEGAGLPWIEAFFARGLSAVQAAVRARLGIGALGASCVPDGAVVLGPASGLPPLPGGDMAFLARPRDPERARALAAVEAALARPGAISPGRRPVR